MGEQTLICADCGAEMVLRESRNFKDDNGERRKFYGCSSYPSCKSTLRAKQDGTPLGTPANQHTKALRVEVHQICDKIWGNYNEATREQRMEMSDWLKKNAPKQRVSEMDAEECETTITLLQTELQTRGIE